MKLSFELFIKPTKEQKLVLDSFGYNAYKLWNVGNYEKRNYQELGFAEFPDWYEQKKRLKDNFFYKNLPSQTAQEVLNVLQQSWKSYFKLLKTKGIKNPKPPRFKYDNIQFSFLNKGFSLKNDELRLSVPKSTKQYMQTTHNLKIDYLVFKLPILKQFSNVKQIKVDRKNDMYRFIIIYEVSDIPVKEDNGKYLFIDMGINNLFTCVDNTNAQAFIIGRKYLSTQHYFDKKIAYYQSIADKQQVAKGIKYPKKTKRILSLYEKKRNSTKDYLHKCTTYIKNYCIQNDISRIIIGDIAHIRDGNNLGAVNNQKLHSLPFDKIYSMLQYKLALCGIMLIKQNEAYSSQCSPNSEKVDKTSADKKNRKKRGCYFENNNLYNADAVGAYNIGRLAMQEGKISKFDIQTKILSSPKKVAV
jgi:putative transposase